MNNGSFFVEPHCGAAPTPLSQMQQRGHLVINVQVVSIVIHDHDGTELSGVAMGSSLCHLMQSGCALELGTVWLQQIVQLERHDCYQQTGQNQAPAGANNAQFQNRGGQGTVCITG